MSASAAKRGQAAILQVSVLAMTATPGDNLPMAESVPAASTRLLRGSDEPLFQRLRALLSERDVDPQSAILADFFPEMSTRSSA